MPKKPLLIGEEAADLLVEYAAAVGEADTADTVPLRAFGADGHEVFATFVRPVDAPEGKRWASSPTTRS